jgi:hypothetical protein
VPDLSTIGRWLFFLGLGLTLLGGLLWAANRLGLPLGQLPGDIRIQRGSFTCFVPLASSILISLLLTLIANLLVRWLGK